ncbi:dephospho-CoA kinase [Bifidobacterium goeldii]|uniref:Dephospho-CoA kinase n=1 Tax=Bifidobacterium goeldii TaxID=2306975 RepID=A0A430FM88_9BIFI|nr:dephospho-CoA kinase [Bifidobacterium goeldii]RSX53986.1 dephospho-CoA kinase [Bifidobacterium goeldii]
MATVIQRIGLTGGIAAGKSTVSAHLRDLGATVIDYDALARLIVAPGSEGLARIVDEFGPAALSANGSLNRAWMAEHVFGRNADVGARERLDAIEHPLIYAQARRLEREVCQSCVSDDMTCKTTHVIVHDVPLLAEVFDSIPFHFNHVVTVEAPIAVRIARMMGERGMTREQALDRIRHQVDDATRRAIADIVIDSTQPIEQMFEVVDRLYASWM